MSKGKNQQGIKGPDSVLGPGVPAPDFKLRSTQSFRPDREAGAPGAPDFKLQTLPPDRFISLSEYGILDALEALGSKREVAA